MFIIAIILIYTSQLTFKYFSFRPFTTPQVLRTGKQAQENDEDEEDEDKVWMNHFLFFAVNSFWSLRKVFCFVIDHMALSVPAFFLLLFPC